MGSAIPVTVALWLALVPTLALCAWAGIRIRGPLDLVVLAATAWVAETFAALVQRFSSLSLTSTLVGVATVLCGPTGACVVGIVATGFCLGRSPIAVRTFNAVMTGWAGLLGGLTLLLLTSEHPARWTTQHVRSLFGPMTAMTVVMLVTNALLLSLVVKVTAGVPAMRTVRDFAKHTAPLFLGGGLISFVMVVLWVGGSVGPVTMVVMAPPLLLAQWALASVAAEASSADQAVDALVTALELNRPGSAAHGELVRTITEEIGNQRGLTDEEIIDLRRAARLHHLGTVGPGAAAVVTIDQHIAQRGAQLLSGIRFLSAVRPIIATATRADEVGTPSRSGAILGTADALACTVEHHLVATMSGEPEQLLGESISSIAERPGLDSASIEVLRNGAFPSLAAQLATIAPQSVRRVHQDTG